MEDKSGLLEIQYENWHYFIETIFSITEKKNYELKNEDEADLEIELSNLQIHKKLLNNFNNFAATTFYEMIFK